MRSQLAVFCGVVVFTVWAASTAAQKHDHDAGTHTHAEAAKLKNPAKSTPASIAAGKTIYDKSCAGCHGVTGKGDGKMAASITGAKPSDLTDAVWTHGASDGEVFTVVRDGVKQTGMRGFASRLKPEDIWNVVIYLRTLAPKPHTQP